MHILFDGMIQYITLNIAADVTHEKAIVHEKHERHELRGAQQTL